MTGEKQGLEDRYRQFAYLECDCTDEPEKPLPKPYDHQEKTWRALKRKRQPLRGIIALPTGAGKTFTAVHWLAKNVLSEPDPRPVLWIAHRAELLQQAAEELHRCRSLCNRQAKLKMRCISGAHGKPISTLLAKADVTFVTIQSLSRREDLARNYLKKNPNCVIVVDEAHHAAAKSYRRFLKLGGKRKNVELLGLTATPTRTLKGEIKYLKDIFTQEVIYQVSLPELIEKGILSRPICKTVKTNQNFDKKFNNSELKQLKKFGELPPSVLAKIGKSVSRNKLIVNHYVDNQSEYKKTLIFATDIPHCYSLTKALQEKGVAADYVASIRNKKEDFDAEDGKYQTIINRYRKGEIQVLVSVEMLTEGVDLPKTESVLLARPTGSEILMRQMVGRALRGPKAGGSKEARIVSFADHWERFPGWLDPFSFLDPEPLPQEKDVKNPPRWPVLVPWELISAISSMSPDIKPSQVFSSIPVGWYALPKGDPEIDHTTAVLVYDHQEEAFKRFLQDSAKKFPVLSGRGGGVAKYFSDVPDPVPTNEQLKRLHYYVNEFGKPTYVAFSEKDTFDPRAVAEENVNKSILQIKKIAKNTYENTLAWKVYTDVNTYIEAVFEELSRLMAESPGALDDIGDPRKKGGRRVPYKNWPLKKMMNEIRKETGLSANPPPDIRWSKRASKSTWGVYRSHDNSIVINRFLRTSAITKRTMAFLIYHELLHRELGVEEGHSKYFRKREREFVGYAEADADLDSVTDRIGVPREDYEINYM